MPGGSATDGAGQAGALYQPLVEAGRLQKAGVTPPIGVGGQERLDVA
jgi:hypothetical protein